MHRVMWRQHCPQFRATRAAASALSVLLQPLSYGGISSTNNRLHPRHTYIHSIVQMGTGDAP
jgi:hypothetical protein